MKGSGNGPGNGLTGYRFPDRMADGAADSGRDIFLYGGKTEILNFGSVEILI
jgi:hypothetical protein